MSSGSLNFIDLRDLHKCANDLLCSPQFKQALVHQRHADDPSVMLSVQEVSETSLKMLDLCGATRDLFDLAKEHLRQLQQIFRKANKIIIEGSNLEDRILDHRLCKKKLKKEIAKTLRDIKEMKCKCFTFDLSIVDHSLIVIVHVLREVRGATVYILESLLSLITSSTMITIIRSQKPSSSKIMRMKCRRFLLERCDSMEVYMANKKLGEVIRDVGKLGVELESIVRRLMQTRVLLLNILTN
ncbi:hypothetical protein vseg_017885 [Gypsophila vaccaria]